MPITITDVAARAGVSSATVSRVLQGSPRVSRAALERVQAAIAELEYRPSGVARSLRRQQTGTLGLIVTNINNPFYPEIVRGAEDAAQRMGASIILCNAAEDPVDHLDQAHAEDLEGEIPLAVPVGVRDEHDVGGVGHWISLPRSIERSLRGRDRNIMEPTAGVQMVSIAPL